MKNRNHPNYILALTALQNTRNRQRDNIDLQREEAHKDELVTIFKKHRKKKKRTLVNNHEKAAAVVINNVSQELATRDLATREFKKKLNLEVKRQKMENKCRS